MSRSPSRGPRRRALLGAAAAAAGLGACSAPSAGRSSAAGGGAAGGGAGPRGQLTLLTWADDAEERAFQVLADGFEAAGGPPVRLRVVPRSEVLTAVDSGLRGADPPDLFRVSYLDIGVYRQQDVLAELPDAGSLEPAFLPAFWGAVTDEDGTFGIPHHADTSVLLVNTDAARSAGIGRLPATLDDAWTWEQFVDVATRIGSPRAGTWPVAVNWQGGGAYRWLDFVDQAGGRLLTDDLTGVTEDDPGMLEALTFTRDLFHRNLVPPTGTTRGQAAGDLFAGQAVAVCFAGNPLLPAFEAAGFPYTATFLPRGERSSADLGGNALVAVEAGERKDAALDFLAYCAGAEQMARFCAATTALPTRSDVDPVAPEPAVRPDLVRLYAEQARAVRSELVEQVALPRFGAVNAELRDRLDEAFRGTEDDTTALRRITDGIASVLTS
ncbi:ABC transporter substrate-binding protein [Kineococcus sp. NUM-3379]